MVGCDGRWRPVAGSGSGHMGGRGGREGAAVGAFLWAPRHCQDVFGGCTAGMASTCTLRMWRSNGESAAFSGDTGRHTPHTPRGAHIGGEICSFWDCCPQKCPHFSGAFYVLPRTLQYQTKVSKLINWRCLSNIGDVSEYAHTYILVVGAPPKRGPSSEQDPVQLLV